MKLKLTLMATICAASLLLQAQINPPAGAGEDRQAEIKQAIQTLELDWAGAVKRRDVERIDRLQAEEYVFTDPGGYLWTKTRELDSLHAGDLVIEAFEMNDVKVRLYDNAAVVTFRIRWHGNFRGTDVGGPQRMTDVFVKRDGRWQCVASQATRIAQP